LKAARERHGTVLTGLEPVVVIGRTEGVKEIILLRRTRYKLPEPRALFPGVKLALSMWAEGQGLPVVTVQRASIPGRTKPCVDCHAI
jgi:hypothetical protein